MTVVILMAATLGNAAYLLVRSVIDMDMTDMRFFVTYWKNFVVLFICIIAATGIGRKI